jgi:hypothetical protein
MLKLSLVFVLLFSTLCTAQTKTPVLVELFTSEGCSSCPPADQLLIQLEQKQPVAGAEVIVLGEHVDYWDQDGWRDRFSSSRFTDRQQNYANHFGAKGPYTPQMVVNGSVEFVGNDSGQAYGAIQRAAASTRETPAITIQRAGDHLHVAVTGAGSRGVNVLCAITERDLSTHVGDGENRGRELHHTAVVRDLRKLGTTRDGRFESDYPLHFSPDWRPENLRAVVFLQNGNAGPISGAAQIALAPAK